MAKETYIRAGGAWRKATEIYIRDGSAWRDVKEAWLRIGGTWQQVFSKVLVTVTGASISDATSSRTAHASVRINSDGTIDKGLSSATVIQYTQLSSTTDWIIPNGSASIDYDVRITNVVWTEGSSFDAAAAAEDVWIDLGSNREWRISDSTSNFLGDKAVSFTVEIRDGSGTTQDTGSYSLTADYDSA